MKRTHEEDGADKRMRIKQILKRTLTASNNVKRQRRQTDFEKGFDAGLESAMKDISNKIDIAVDNVVNFYEMEIRQYSFFDTVPKWVF